MNTDPGILCFQHCDKKVFCFELPEICPVCSKDLSTAQFKLLPTRIPYPFVRAAQHPCSILIKPTSGDFLNDYFNSVDLHIGVTDSTGAVVEYDKNGLQRQKNNQWNQCLVLDGMDESWADQWDEALKTVIKEGHWTPQMYNENSHNCYTFVLAFLQKLEHDLLSNAANSSIYFCEKFILPRTTAAGKYISLYRKLRAVDCYIHGGPDVNLRPYQEPVPSR
ncbi:hypothetical protein RUM44_003424 [Polyplax serrata]|uniref:MKRN2 opposite strand protein n=1 Tax=Polyplax serrata TaxID=468196 RepID=A0ABR1AGY6_POLSC